MRLSTNLLPIQLITSNIDAYELDQEKLQKLTDSILKTGSVINPIIVEQIKHGEYEVIDGFLQYHAFAKARQIDPEKIKQIEVYILNDDIEEEKLIAIFEQIKILRSTSSENKNIVMVEDSQDTILHDNIKTKAENDDKKVKLKQAIVMVEDIQDPGSHEKFSCEEIEEVAESILQLGCLINPIIVKRNGIDSFTIVNGFLAYYGAKEAERLNPMAGETINVFIATTESIESAALENQIYLLREEEIAYEKDYK